MSLTKTNVVNQALIALGELVVSDVDTDTSKRATTMKELYDVKLKYLLRKFEWKFAIKRATLTVIDYKLNFDAEATAFVVGEVASGAVGEGTVEYLITNGTSGTLWLSNVTTGFVDDENVTGDIAGDITIDGVEQSVTPIYEFDNIFALPSDYVKLIQIYPNYIPYRIESNFILCSESDELDIKYTYHITDPDEWDSTFVEAFAALLAREAALPITDSLRKQKKMDEMFEDKIADARFSGSIEDDIQEMEIKGQDDWLQSRY